MSDRAWVERELRGLSGALAVPPAPDVRAAVRARLAASVPGRRRPPRRAVQVVATALIALLLLALTPPGQAAVTRLWRFGGVVFSDRQLAPVPSPGGRAGGPGAEALPGQVGADLASARRAAAFELVVPAGLGVPDRVLISDRGRVVSLLYGPGPGRPPAVSGGVSARLDEFAGTGEPVFQKSVSDAGVQPVEVGGRPGIWVPAPHEVLYVERDGSFTSAPPHLAGQTLIWQVGQVTLRLEGDFGRERALAVAGGRP